MSDISIPKANYVPHPEGQHRGIIRGIENKGEVETQFGIKPKIVVQIESETAFLDDGSPFAINRWFTISSHPKAALREFRETLKGGKLTDEEIDRLRPEVELIGRRVGYSVVHREGQEGTVFSNTTNIWPLDSSAPPPTGTLKAATPSGGPDPNVDGSGNGELPETAEGAMAKVLATAATNGAATTAWVKQRLQEEGKDVFSATFADWEALWLAVKQDIPI